MKRASTPSSTWIYGPQLSAVMYGSKAAEVTGDRGCIMLIGTVKRLAATVRHR